MSDPRCTAGFFTYKHWAGGWIGFNLTIRQRPSGLIQVRSDPPAGAISCCAAQVAVSTQSLTRAIAYLKINKNSGVRTVQRWRWRGDNCGGACQSSSGSPIIQFRQDADMIWAKNTILDCAVNLMQEHLSWLCPTTVLASESWLVLLVRIGGSELVTDSVSLFWKPKWKKKKKKFRGNSSWIPSSYPTFTSSSNTNSPPTNLRSRGDTEATIRTDLGFLLLGIHHLGALLL